MYKLEERYKKKQRNLAQKQFLTGSNDEKKENVLFWWEQIKKDNLTSWINT